MAEEHDGILKSIDRRHFLQKTGALAAGSIFCGTITSCASYANQYSLSGPQYGRTGTCCRE